MLGWFKKKFGKKEQEQPEELLPESEVPAGEEDRVEHPVIEAEGTPAPVAGDEPADETPGDGGLEPEPDEPAEEIEAAPCTDGVAEALVHSAGREAHIPGLVEIDSIETDGEPALQPEHEADSVVVVEPEGDVERLSDVEQTTEDEQGVEDVSARRRCRQGCALDT